MRRIICILMCLCMVSMVSALSITNGNFENGHGGAWWDIQDWYDYGDDTLAPPTGYPTPAGGYYQGPFQYNGSSDLLVVDGDGAVLSGERVSEAEDGSNHAYIYQSIGIYDGTESAIDIELDWKVPNISYASSGELGVTVMILESDGTFEPNEWNGAAHDIYGFVRDVEDPEDTNPITEIGRGTAFGRVEKGDPARHERFQVDLSDATIGNELFLRLNAYRGDLDDNTFDQSEKPWVVMDNVKMSIAYVLNQSPEDGAVYVNPELTSSENDLVFNVTDPVVIAVDVLLSTDPNLPYPGSVIKSKLATPAAGQYTVDLEDLSQDLAFEKDYYWKVLAYESDGGTGYTLKYTGLATNFKTIQYGPFLDDVDPDIQAVWPGEDAVFELEYYNKTDTFQWYKEGQVDPLENGAKYSGVDSNTLTIYNCQTADEGFYYCKGWYTESGPTVVEAQSTASGELAIKELKAYYPFDSQSGGFTMDTVGGRDAQLMGGASLVANSLAGFGNCLSLVNPRNLSNPYSPVHTQYAEIADNAVAHHKEITISCWVKPSLLDTDYERSARLFAFGTENGDDTVDDDFFYLTLLQSTNTARCEVGFTDDDDAEANDLDASSSAIGYGTQWLYVVLTIGDYTEINEETGEEEVNTTGKIYINGEHVGEGGLYHPSDVNKTHSYIGKAVLNPPKDAWPLWSVYPNFNGLIDELKIYNYVKTAEEIAREYMAVRTEIESICNMDDYDLGDWDFDGNCVVDLPDLAEMAEKWLVNYFIYPD